MLPKHSDMYLNTMVFFVSLLLSLVNRMYLVWYPLEYQTSPIKQKLLLQRLVHAIPIEME